MDRHSMGCRRSTTTSLLVPCHQSIRISNLYQPLAQNNQNIAKRSRMDGLLLLLCFFLSIAVTARQFAVAAAASSSKVVTSLPGLQGRLPFHLETGYVEVDEENGAKLFYYFVESEAGAEDAPFLLWLSGGDRCSVLSGLALEIGPFQFVPEPYNGTVPRLKINPYSWTKVANILFVDTPVGAGYSFSRRPEGYDVGEISTWLQLHELLIRVESWPCTSTGRNNLEER